MSRDDDWIESESGRAIAQLAARGALGALDRSAFYYFLAHLNDGRLPADAAQIYQASRCFYLQSADDWCDAAAAAAMGPPSPSSSSSSSVSEDSEMPDDVRAQSLATIQTILGMPPPRDTADRLSRQQALGIMHAPGTQVRLSEFQRVSLRRFQPA